MTHFTIQAQHPELSSLLSQYSGRDKHKEFILLCGGLILLQYIKSQMPEAFSLKVMNSPLSEKWDHILELSEQCNIPIEVIDYFKFKRKIRKIDDKLTFDILEFTKKSRLSSTQLSNEITIFTLETQSSRQADSSLVALYIAFSIASQLNDIKTISSATYRSIATLEGILDGTEYLLVDRNSEYKFLSVLNIFCLNTNPEKVSIYHLDSVPQLNFEGTQLYQGRLADLYLDLEVDAPFSVDNAGNSKNKPDYLLVNPATELNIQNKDSLKIQKALSEINNTGTTLVYCRPQVLHKKGYDDKVREYLISQNLVDMVITFMPSRLIGKATIGASSIIVLSKNKHSNCVTFINAYAAKKDFSQQFQSLLNPTEPREDVVSISNDKLLQHNMHSLRLSDYQEISPSLPGTNYITLKKNYEIKLNEFQSLQTHFLDQI